MSGADSNGRCQREVGRDCASSDHDSGVRPRASGSASVARSQANGDPQRSRTARVEQIVREHFGLIWRVGQRLGLQSADAEDVAQRVMVVAARRLDDLIEGKERAFLVRTTFYMADKVRRARQRRAEELSNDLSEWAAQSSGPDDAADQRGALRELDRVLNRLPEDLRKVLVLFEIEGFSQSEIGETLRIPQGTVASRIRRARARFLGAASRSGLMRGGQVP
jgi:RNA polymerase sigma-70 factor (ECF subfamily)